jgi:hypothetical protein
MTLLDTLRSWWPKPPPRALTDDEAAANLRLNDEEKVHLAHVENIAAIEPTFFNYDHD